MTERLEVSFAGPFSWPGAPDAPSLLDVEERRGVGIYLWTVPVEDGHLVYYVGETGRGFGTRMLEHYAEHAACMYHVYEPEAFARGEKVAVWPGRYDPADRKSPKQCMAEYPRLAAQVHELTHLYRFMLAPLSCDDRVRRRAEAAIANLLYEAPGRVGAFQDRNIRYQPRRQDEPPVLCQIRSTVPLLGVPEDLEA